MKARISLPVAVALLLVGPIAGAIDAKDAWISTKAKVALLTADDVSVTSIHVDTKDGMVTLHGKVKSAPEKTRAEAAVKKVDGVKGINNLLQVVPDAFKEATQVADATVKDKVEAALKADASLKGIKVSSVNDGVVLLSGKTDSVQKELRAIEAARAVAGVRRVASEVQLEVAATNQ